MIYLRAVKRTDVPLPRTYPMNTPLMQNLTRLAFDRPVTLLCGDNGSGKTTLVELLAAKLGAQRIDAQFAQKAAAFLDQERAVALEMVRRPARSFFFQAEDFIRYLDAWFAGENRDMDMVTRYGDLSAQSHGEGFLSFFGARITRNGLYLLDEPEAALSPANQLVLLHLIADAEAQGCQFIISTHSPVLLAYPGACVYELRNGQALPTHFQDLEHVRFLRSFLNDTDSYVRLLHTEP